MVLFIWVKMKGVVDGIIGLKKEKKNFWNGSFEDCDFEL